jgi:hypothetical protein
MHPEHGPPGGPTVRLVLVALACHMDNVTGECFPSVATVAARCALSERAVQKALRLAVESGWLTARERTRETTVYVLANPPKGEPRAPGERGAPGERKAPARVNVVHPEGERGAPELPHPDSGKRTPKSTRSRARTKKPDPYTFVDVNGWSWADIEPRGKRCAHGALVPRINAEEQTVFAACREFPKGCDARYDPREPARAVAAKFDAEHEAKLAAARQRPVLVGAHAGRPMTPAEIAAASHRAPEGATLETA